MVALPAQAIMMSEGSGMSQDPKVTVKDWKHVAQVAGKHNVRFPTNWRLEAFLSEIHGTLDIAAHDQPSADSRDSSGGSEEAATA